MTLEPSSQTQKILSFLVFDADSDVPPEVSMKIITLDSVDSTNSYCLSHPEILREPFLAVRAIRQTAGRGRFSRKWESEPQGKDLTFSFVTHPETESSISAATAGAGLAVQRVLTVVSGVKTKIKWPNDLLWDGKKLCGILAERTDSDGRDVLVIGIGINFNSETSRVQPSAISIREITGRESDPETLLQKITAEYRLIMNNLPFSQQILSEWNACCISIGREVTFADGNALGKGIITGLDSNGAIVIVRKDTTEIHYTGEIDYGH